MDEGAFSPNTMFGNIDYDVMDHLLDEGCWLRTADGSNFLQPGSSSSQVLSFTSYGLSNQETNSANLTSVSDHQSSYQEENQSLDPKSQDQNAIQVAKSSSPTPNLSWEGNLLNRMMWIAPMAYPSPSTSVRNRLTRAIEHFMLLNKDGDVLIQIWVPVREGLKNFLTTVKQPYFHQPTSSSLFNYRDVSERYQFLADEDTKQALGLPGRVFLGKVPEWTPDVRFFKEEEYPRSRYAHMYKVQGSIALPVFERGAGVCLGVVELIMTTQKIDYHSEVESICKALEAVDLRSSEMLSPSNKEGGDESNAAILSEIFYTLKAICDAHQLPLAQTWSPCIQQGKGGCWCSDKKSQCVSTVNTTCYIRDPRISDFHKACAEHHLLIGQGVVGKAFETHQPCFSTDVTEFSKSDYPLSHHAMMFQLHGAVAIRVCSVYNDETDYVLEFFLPLDFNETGLTFHNRILESLSIAMQQQCQNLRFVTNWDPKQQLAFSLGQNLNEEAKLESSDPKSWISHVMGSQRKGKEVVSLEFSEEQNDEFRVTSQWGKNEEKLQLGHILYDPGNVENDPRIGGSFDSSSFGGRRPLGARKAGEKRRTKAQKTISLQVLKQYFAGSLKSAAQSIGVCPTTLKRICRQHGINRWPSRKIKKVGHSLKKLQLVIDSVQGAEGAIQLSSFYANFPQLNAPTLPNPNQPSSKVIDQPKHQNTLSFGPNTSKSPSTSSSQTSTSSHSTGAKTSSPATANVSGSVDALTAEDPSSSLKRARSEAELHVLSKKEPKDILERSQSNKSLGEHPLVENLPPLPRNSGWRLRGGTFFKVKATFGDEKVRFSISQNTGLGDLQQEILKRFNIDDLSKVGLKYLDDDREWVLLTCDADLEECIDIHKSTRTQTIKLSLSPFTSLGGSFGSSGLS